MTGSHDEDPLRKAHAESCMGCGAWLAVDQRYCFECGTRHGPLPPLVATRVEALRQGGRPRPGATVAGGPPVAAEAEVEKGGEEAEEKGGYWSFMPSPQVAAVAVMALLAAGVVLGSVTSPFAQSAGFAPIVLELAEGPSAGSPEPASAPGYTAEPGAPAPAAEEPLASAFEPPQAEPEASEPGAELPPELPEETLPEIKHVFLIVLDGHGYEEAFGKASSAPYLAQTLAGQGELLSNYYAVTQGSLANEIALLSGQGPTAETAANCPVYTDIAPGTAGVEEQVAGSGCVYPAATQTLPGQLAAAKLTWKAYVEGIGNGAGQPAACRHPALGGPDANQAPLPGDAYETWRNPFVYFHSLLDDPECAQSDVGLDQLGTDLGAAKSTPSLSYIVPDACHDGSEAPCAPAQPAGLTVAEGFLQTVVPEIAASAAYKEGGLIAITFAQAPQTGPQADSSACCVTPEYPNLPTQPAPVATAPASGPVKPSGGGGRVGMLLISPYVKAGSVNESYYNHFSLLRSVEELFALQPLGYAANEALIPFDSTVYTAEP